MSNPVISKEQALDLHREMWIWIAEQYHNHSQIEVDILMEEFGEKNGTYLVNPCCKYNSEELLYNKISYGRDYCCKCPVIWGSEDKCQAWFCDYEYDYIEWTALDGLITQMRFFTCRGQYENARDLAIKIANLPERIDDDYQNENQVIKDGFD